MRFTAMNGELARIARERPGLRNEDRYKVALLLAPLTAVIGGLFAGGLVIAAAQSLGYYSPIGEHGFTFKHYLSLPGDAEFLAGLRQTLWVTVTATAISAVCGTALALALHRTASGAIRTLLQVPLALPHLAMAVVLINLIAPSGLFARILFHLGLIASPAGFPVLINDRFSIGIIVTYMLKEIPFITVMAMSLLARVGDEYDDLARTLGASRLHRLRHVTLPLIAPAVISSSVIVFSFIFGAFEVPYILGRPYPAMLSVIAQRRYMDLDLTQRPEAIAVAMVIASITTLLAWLNLRLTSRLTGTERISLF